MTGASIFLAYYHYCNKGVYPFSTECKDSDLQNLAELDEESINFIKYTRNYAKEHSKSIHTHAHTHAEDGSCKGPGGEIKVLTAYCEQRISGTICMRPRTTATTTTSSDSCSSRTGRPRTR